MNLKHNFQEEERYIMFFLYIDFKKIRKCRINLYSGLQIVRNLFVEQEIGMTNYAHDFTKSILELEGNFCFLNIFQIVIIILSINKFVFETDLYFNTKMFLTNTKFWKF